MVHDLSQDVGAVPSGAAPRQAIAGLMPPQLGEVRIREAWPSLAAVQGGLSRMAERLMKTVFLAPLGWLTLLPLFVRKFLPSVCRRYTLTNRRLMIQRGLRPSPAQEIALSDIDEVRLVPDSFDRFYLSGTLEVVSKGQVALTLAGVPEPEGFRHAVVNAVKAWVPGKATGPFQPASAVK